MHAFSALAAICLFVFCSASSYAQPQEKPADVRLVLDVSGSMKLNDPNNLRQPAVDLLVRLLPPNSKAGVWTFGRYVNMLVKHGPVDEKWKQNARTVENKINSVGLYTNIGEALEKASYDHATADENYNTSIIILTDGMVDIDKDPDANNKEWRRIVDEVIPKLETSGFTVHTVALSDNADQDLLSKLSLSTDGIAATAHSADDLMRIFLDAFDAAAPAQQLPLTKDASFVVDSSIEEFTALIFRKDKQEMTQLIGPDDYAIDADNLPPDAAWYRADNYDLITVKRPLEGSWNALVEMAPGSRITVMSNLSLQVEPLPTNVKLGGEIKLRFLLRENGKTITRPEFLSLMSYRAEIQYGGDATQLRPIWKEKLNFNVPPVDGVYETTLPEFKQSGTYQFSFTVDGRSFSRQFKHQFIVRHPFSAQIKKATDPNGGISYLLTVRANSTSVDFQNTQAVATVFSPDNGKKVVPLTLSKMDNWQAPINVEEAGKYRIKIKVSGRLQSGDDFSHLLNPLVFIYDPQAEFESAAALVVEKQEDKYLQDVSLTSPTPVLSDKEEGPKTVLEQEEEQASSEPPSAPQNEPPIPAWALYSILGAGNLFLFVAGYIAYRKIMGGNSEEDELAEDFEGAQEEVVEEEAPEMIITDSDDEEPPMEDLDPGGAVVEEELDADAAEAQAGLSAPAEKDLIDEDEFDLGGLTDEDLGLSESPDDSADLVEPESDAASEAADAGNAENSEGQSDIPELSEDGGGNIPGLDIPEEELDNAISDLIEELGAQDGESTTTDENFAGDNEINLDDFDFDDDDD